MSVLDALFNGPAGKWVRAKETATVEEINFEGLLIHGDDNYCNPIPGAPILPGRDFERITYDLADWDGISLEFRGYYGDVPTEEEQERIWALGFTVIRIDFKDGDPRKKPKGSNSGDWWREKGYPLGHCSCHADECECHPADVRARRAEIQERAKFNAARNVSAPAVAVPEGDASEGSAPG